MGIIRKIASSDSEFADHPDMDADISMQGYMFTRRKPTQPFKRVWCVLRGGTLFLYLGQNEKAPRSCYAVNGATIETQGLQDDGRYRFELVTMERVDGGPGLQLNFAADLTRVATPFETLTEGDMTGWLHALAASHKDKGSMDGFRIAAVSGVVHGFETLAAGTDVNTRSPRGGRRSTGRRAAAVMTPSSAAQAQGQPEPRRLSRQAPLRCGGARLRASVRDAARVWRVDLAADAQRLHAAAPPPTRRMQARTWTRCGCCSRPAPTRLRRRRPSRAHLAFHGNVELIRTLLGHGVAAGCRDRDGYTPLHLAARGTRPGGAMLLERDANVLATDGGGATPLHLAASQGNTEAVRSMVRMFAAPLDPADQYGRHCTGQPTGAQVVNCS